jgi:hypothetical protein
MPSMTAWMRAAMLAVIALVALGNALAWVDADLSVPFVCIIAVMGIGTRGGVLDTLPFVLFELAVVVVLGVATFSESRDFVWAASVAISIVAVGKIALLRIGPAKDDAKPEAKAPTKPKEKES